MIKSENKLLNIVSVFIASVFDIDSITELGENATLVFKSTKDWEEIYFIKGSLEYKELSSTTDVGLLYAQELTFSVPGDDSTIQEQLHSYKDMPVVIRFDYDSGVSKIIGNMENWIDVLNDFSSVDFETKRLIRLLRNSTKPALFLT